MESKQIRNYNFAVNEKKWQQKWEENQTFVFDKNNQKPKYYVLEMLPYPSGNLHMGHIRNYTIGDVKARYKKMQGFNVIHPMGWDAFGLPAENAAIEGGIHPEIWTKKNIANMKEQLKKVGFSYDWSLEIATCDADYYKHEQQMFIDFYNKGLIYQKETEVNWDPVDNTVLANEQVVDGKGWRSGAIVEKRKLKQWFLKISDYAEELLEGLDNLPDWPEKVKTMQKNWIGKSVGAEVDFICDNDDKIKIFTTRPDTLFGASFVAISPQHPLAEKLALNNDKIADFIVQSKLGRTSEEELATKEKKGINTGLFCTLKLDIEIKIPVFIANFVLMDYGTGAIFGCPAHDERDYEFAIKYDLPITGVVHPGLFYDDTKGWSENKDVFCNTTSITRKNLTGVIDQQYINNYVKFSLMEREKRKPFDNKYERDGWEKAILESCKIGDKRIISCPFAEPGISINSGLLSGLTTKQAKQKMIEVLSQTKQPQNYIEFNPEKYLGAILETTNFVLRPFNENDFESLRLLHGDEQVMKYMLSSIDKVETPEKTKEVLERYKTWQQKDGFSRWAIFKKPEKFDNKKDIWEQLEFAGRMGPGFFYEAEKSKYVNKNDIEIGYAFLKQFWGKGYATEILKAVLYWVIKNYPKARVVAATHPDHIASQKVLQKTGFEYVGSETVDEDFGEEKIFILNKDKFNDIFLGKIGNSKTSYRLRDWGVSRQRYWGCPVPMVYCPKCGIVPERSENLPIKLPMDVDFKSTGNPLDKNADFIHCKCPKCGEQAKRETDTLDTFFESSWYFLRYICPNEKTAFNKIDINKFLPVDNYIGGVEHAVMHLLYARFFVKALRDCGYLNFDEPFKALLTQGMVCHRAYQNSVGKWLFPDEVENGIEIKTGEKVTDHGVIKMSKSKKNVVDPLHILDVYGADTARLFMMSDTPPERDLEWSVEVVDSVFKYINRLYKIAFRYKETKPDLNDKNASEKLEIAKHKATRDVTIAIESWQLNKMVSSIREFSNSIEELISKTDTGDAIKTLFILISPVTPHLAQECWTMLGYNDFICNQPWPEFDLTKLEKSQIIIAIQVNGKLRGTIEVDKNSTEEEQKKVALEVKNVVQYVQTGIIKKTVVIKNKIINFIVEAK